MSQINNYSNRIHSPRVSIYGSCSECGADLEAVFFTELEYKNGVHTGRQRRAVDYLVCPICFTRECVDDTFDEPWVSSYQY